MNAEIAAGAFWLVEGFWPMAGVLVLFAAGAALLIADGPDEVPFEQEHDGEDQP
ncbi:hypothetical protein [Arthrobacter sp. UYCu712]|uniref:hypothetical protein n=1 Tax=Arthrobacter sp. UYCu712 TaxID=3156340 RepID=UPI0033953208